MKVKCKCGCELSFEGLLPARHKCFRCGEQVKPLELGKIVEQEPKKILVKCKKD